MGTTAVTLEIDQEGEIAEAILEAIASDLEVSRPSGQRCFRVSAEDIGLGELRVRVARTASIAIPDWDDYSGGHAVALAGASSARVPRGGPGRRARSCTR